MIPVKHIDPEDLPLYAMDLLPPDQAEEMRLNLQHSPEARRVLADLRGDLALLAFTAEAQDAPQRARERLLRQVEREQKIVAQEVPSIAQFTPRALTLVEEPAPRSGFRQVLPWVGWALAAGLALEAGSLYQARQRLERAVDAEHAELARALDDAALAHLAIDTVRSPSAQQVVLAPGEIKTQPQGRVSYDAAKGSLVMIASNLQPLEPNKTYELWLLPADGQKPIAAGTFQPDSRGSASVILPKLPPGTAAAGFGVTVEDAEGSQTPTLPILLKGAAA